MAESTRSTGNEPVENIDPGGTRGRHARAGKTTVHTVTSGDRNAGRPEELARDLKPEAHD